MMKFLLVLYIGTTSCNKIPQSFGFKSILAPATSKFQLKLGDADWRSSAYSLLEACMVPHGAACDSLFTREQMYW